MGTEAMNREDIEKLIGGYATGTLTPAEEQALFAAALEDQRLFDALMADQPLCDLLGDPAARANLLVALSDRRAPWYRRFARPLIAVAALLLIAAPVAIWQASRRTAPQPVLTAQMSEAPKPEPRAVPSQLPASQPTPSEPVRARPKVRQAPPVATQTSNAPVAAVKPAEVEAEAKDQRDAVGALQPATEATQPKAAAPATQNVEVTAQSAGVRPAAPVPGFVPQSARSKASPVFAMLAPSSPIKTTVLRRNEDGTFVAADANDLHAGDTVKLRLELPHTGYVYVSEQQKLLAQSAIEAGKPFETVLEAHGAGTRQLEIRFSPRPVIWNTAAGTGIGALGGAAPAGSPGIPPLTLTLQYK